MQVRRRRAVQLLVSQVERVLVVEQRALAGRRGLALVTGHAAARREYLSVFNRATESC